MWLSVLPFQCIPGHASPLLKCAAVAAATCSHKHADIVDVVTNDERQLHHAALTQQLHVTASARVQIMHHHDEVGLTPDHTGPPSATPADDAQVPDLQQQVASLKLQLAAEANTSSALRMNLSASARAAPPGTYCQHSNCGQLSSAVWGVY